MWSISLFEYEQPIGRVPGGQRVAVAGTTEYCLRRIRRCIGDVDDTEDRSEEFIKDA